tara:strand:+ start:61 stop:1419 length:1359 start_codon:yes stop_codon:yes gene_type:complete
MANVNAYSTGVAPQGQSLHNNRRIFNFGDRVAELAPQQSPFFVYLSKVAKKPTDDPVFKFLEQRHQWQRRNFKVEAAWTNKNWTAGTALGSSDDLTLHCGVFQNGRLSGGDNSACHFVTPGVILALYDSTAGAVKRIKVSESAVVGTTIVHSGTDGTNGLTTIDGEVLIPMETDSDVDIADEANGQIIGSAFEEGSDAPTGWEDELYDREGYCQIFKTGMNLFSGTARATQYRGVKNEYQRVWQEKLMEHKMDMEQAFLFGSGTAAEAGTANIVRMTHGIVPYTESNGKVYNMTYASSGYDAFLDAMEDFFAPESGNSGNKLVLASRKVITYLNKLGSGSFMNNTVGSSQYSLDVKSIPGAFGHQVTVVNTIFGNLHFVAEPLFRGPWEDYCCAVDMKNVAYRPLVGNGISRDTFIETNVQANGIDGRRDMILTEAGLEVSLPETHAILKFS